MGVNGIIALYTHISVGFRCHDCLTTDSKNKSRLCSTIFVLVLQKLIVSNYRGITSLAKALAYPMTKIVTFNIESLLIYCCSYYMVP